MQTIETRLPLARLDRFWAQTLGCEPADLRSGDTTLVPCGQRQIQILVTPDGAAVIGLPHLIEQARGIEPGKLLSLSFWARAFDLPESQITHYGPGLLAYVTERSFRPHPHDFVRQLRRSDAGELARFARILEAREPQIFNSWAIGGRVTANERLWGAYFEGKIVAVAGIRPLQRGLFEVGINTLPYHRRKGWGTAVASTATQGGLRLAPLIQWSAPLLNEPSQRIARRLGYLPYAHQLWLSLPDRVIDR